ncbi:hypothetical protein FNV43_RR01242 [Rhamnella rubrinervis]|uniref:Uncharacterized protein n=1 Tax=Rhamnella rubrinervis TaxID=2594499 RepID=A0A8K0HR35_9ROSA|nr:hypothetical protein FNV43_RR01242 [Rhamnella rubrinervis]
MSSSLVLENHVQTPKEEEEESMCYAIQLVYSSGLPLSLICAMELGVFDIIAKAGPGAKLSPTEIAAKLPITNNPGAPSMLESILMLLASHSVLSCSVSDENASQRLYGLLPVCKFFVTDKDGVSLRPYMQVFQDNVFLASWSQLKDAILEGGIPFQRVHGITCYEYERVDPRFNQVYNTAMYNKTSITTKKILEVYKGFDANIKQLVDVGGGFGLNIHLITQTYPHIKGINFDLPHVVQNAPSYPGVEHVGGDMFVSVPSGDAIFMKAVLPSLSDEKCVELLRNCYKAIPENGKVILVDPVVPIIPGTSTADKCTSLLNVILLTQHEGGKERTKEELLAVATKAGFSGINFQCHDDEESTAAQVINYVFEHEDDEDSTAARDDEDSTAAQVINYVFEHEDDEESTAAQDDEDSTAAQVINYVFEHEDDEDSTAAQVINYVFEHEDDEDSTAAQTIH